jgi:IMP dehydrogenase/GMP reductase
LREKAEKRATLKKSRQYKAYKGVTSAITPKLPKKKKQTKKISRKMRIRAF